jgi:hypothetical protein
MCVCVCACKLACIECSFCRLIRHPGSILESLIGRQCGNPWQTECQSFSDHLDQCSLAPPSVTEASLCCALFSVFMAYVRYNLEQRVFIYDCYVTTNLYKSCRRKFCHKFPYTTCPSGDTISKLVKKVQTYGILIDKAIEKKSCFNWRKKKTWWHQSSIIKFSSKIFVYSCI